MEQAEKETGKRQSNLELLRIVSMILIVAHHYSVHGGFILPEMNFNKAFIQVLSLGGKLGEALGSNMVLFDFIYGDLLWIWDN